MTNDVDVLRKRLEKLNKTVFESEALLAVATKELKQFFGTTNPSQVKRKVAEMQRAAEVAEQQYNKARAEFEKKWGTFLNEDND